MSPRVSSNTFTILPRTPADFTPGRVAPVLPRPARRSCRNSLAVVAKMLPRLLCIAHGMAVFHESAGFMVVSCQKKPHGRNPAQFATRGVDSCPRRLCYLPVPAFTKRATRGNFSDTTVGHQNPICRSLDPAFAPASLAVEDTVKPAYTLKFYCGVLSRMS